MTAPVDRPDPLADAGLREVLAEVLMREMGCRRVPPVGVLVSPHYDYCERHPRSAGHGDWNRGGCPEAQRLADALAAVVGERERRTRTVALDCVRPTDINLIRFRLRQVLGDSTVTAVSMTADEARTLMAHDDYATTRLCSD